MQTEGYMWIIRWILIALMVLVVLGFALQNQSQTVSVTVLKWQSPIVPLYLLLYLAFAAGLAFWVLISALTIFKLKGEKLKLQRENKRITQELNRMRNASIEEEPEATEIAEEIPPEQE
jgi:uncharacterized integral membrane protein